MSRIVSTWLNFNPRTHEGCDKNPKAAKALLDMISIHAPTRGATHRYRQNSKSHWNISIHAPTRGATNQRHLQSHLYFYFNPRTHEGCDMENRGQGQSISNFNPRTHEGCDEGMEVKRDFLRDFNPRTHEGCDISTSTILDTLV